MRPTTFFALLLALSSASAMGSTNGPVRELDLDRYSGQWHEIARLPQFFQRNCVADVTARYTRLAGDRIEVRNACTTADGKRLESVGEARPSARTPGALQVRFAPRWLAWVPFVWADYWVVDLDPNYQWAVVGGPSRRYMWVLSREPRMDPALYASIVARAKARGYDVDKLIASTPATP